MKTKLLSLLAAMLAVVCVSCSKPGPRIVEAPAVTATNGSTLTIRSVELNDSATVVNFHARFRPGWWIKIAPESHLVADGKTYAMTGTDGIEPGKEFWMPESGEADFSATFEPLPFATETVDFTEGMSDGWMLLGIDLTGRHAAGEAPEYPESLPKAVRKLADADICIEPEMKAAMTEIRFHVMDYRPEYGDKLRGIIDHIAGPEEYEVALDSLGNATLNTPLYGTSILHALGLGEFDMLTSGIYVAPGEAIDVYVDPAASGDRLMRMNDDSYRQSLQRVFDNGRYAALNCYMSRAWDVAMPEFSESVRWDMNAGEFTDSILSVRGRQHAAIDASDLPQQVKTLRKALADARMLSFAVNAVWVLRNDYFNKKKTEDGVNDSVKIEMTPAEYARLGQAIDAADRYMLMSGNVYDEVASGADWMKYGASTAQPAEVKAYGEAFVKAKSGRLTEAMTAALDSLSTPFYGEAVRMRQQVAEEALRKSSAMITANPDVADDKLFDAIVAPYKGKVVLVDIWNTWCGPCRAALKANEPLKDGELASDDIVWVYIADESSDMNKYVSMIPGIRGVHHMVSSSQISAIRDRFKVDGIPYYILVDRAGRAEGHPDFRNHARLTEGIKAKL